MKYRKLRIAWSVAWSIVAVLLCVLWVRSYSRHEFWDWPKSSQLTVHVYSTQGSMRVSRSITAAELRAAHAAANPPPRSVKDLYRTASINLNTNVSISPILDRMPFWGLSTIAVMVLLVVWIPWSWRFSLRTLFIATTLVAVALGLIVYSLRA